MAARDIVKLSLNDNIEEKEGESMFDGPETVFQLFIL
jgi:hypothetical protein